MKNHNAEQFYDEVLKALWGYMSYKLNIDRAELNRDNISEILQSKGVEEDRIKDLSLYWILVNMPVMLPEVIPIRKWGKYIQIVLM